jgi:hypothetical protein
MKDLEILKTTHPLYSATANNANYLYQSYIGGETYRAGQHLTQYQGEGANYTKRLNSTPLDNQVQTTVDIYRSFLFRNEPVRELGNAKNNPLVQEFIDDTDQQGQGINSFLKSINDLAMVTGGAWVLVDKPNYKVNTQAEEIMFGIRGYCAVYNPQNVLDWNYTRDISGKLSLDYIKVKEAESQTKVTITEWDKEFVTKYTILKDDTGEWGEVIGAEQYDNPLGIVPFVFHAPIKSPVNGIGHSLIQDVADQQKYIYSLYSEIEQSVRISGHPTLVKSHTADATAGAGSIINIDENADPGHNPYLLQPTNAGITGILDTIEMASDSIKRMSHTSSVQATKGSPMSGVALSMERTLLNAKLSDISDTINETEQSIWKLFFMWAGMELPANFEVTYNKSFDARDDMSDLEKLAKAIEINDDADFVAEVKEMIRKIITT